MFWRPALAFLYVFSSMPAILACFSSIPSESSFLSTLFVSLWVILFCLEYFPCSNFPCFFCIASNFARRYLTCKFDQTHHHHHLISGFLTRLHSHCSGVNSIQSKAAYVEEKHSHTCMWTRSRVEDRSPAKFLSRQQWLHYTSRQAWTPSRGGGSTSRRGG